MFLKSQRRSAAIRCATVLIVLLGASSCGSSDGQKKMAPKNQKPIYCDTNISVDVDNGPDVDPVYLCPADTLTWSPATPDTTFVITFTEGTPFADKKAKFNETNAKDTAEQQYGQLTVYKYLITVTKAKPNIVVRSFDPQVVAGGNP